MIPSQSHNAAMQMGSRESQDIASRSDQDSHFTLESVQGMRVKLFIKGLRYHPPQNRQEIKPKKVMISMIFICPICKPQISDQQLRGLVREKERERNKTVQNIFILLYLFHQRTKKKISSDVFDDCVDICLNG